jgi:tyrosinase
MYQSAYPDRYFTKQNVGTNVNVWLDIDADVDANTDLVPFRKASGGFWTTNDVRSTMTFGYTYPETNKPAGTTDEMHTSAVSEDIVRLYSSSARSMLVQQAASGDVSLLSGNGTFTDWAISAKPTSGNLPPSFVVRFYLDGDRPSEPDADVGTWVKLMPSGHNAMQNHGPVTEETHGGTVSLTATLLDMIARKVLVSLDVKDVVPYLKDNLNWMVLDVGLESCRQCIL